MNDLSLADTEDLIKALKDRTSACVILLLRPPKDAHASGGEIFRATSGDPVAIKGMMHDFLDAIRTTEQTKMIARLIEQMKEDADADDDPAY